LDEAPEDDDALGLSKTMTYLVLGGFSLWLGSETLIKGAVSLAQNLGVSERIISVSIVSVGTSIPELSASIIAIINKEKAISLGNLIGSNIFNILAVMGITAMIHPVAVEDTGLLSNDIWWMFGNFSFDPSVGVFSQRRPIGLDRWLDIDNPLLYFYFTLIYVK
jgi:cation:H+ antiporter